MTQQSTLATDGPGEGLMLTPLSPEAFDQACRALVAQFQGHELHRRIDLLVTELLCSLGYSDGMQFFLAHALPYHTKDNPHAD